MGQGRLRRGSAVKSLIDVLEEIAHYKPGTVVFDRQGVGYKIESLISLYKRGKLRPKAALKKKEFFGGTTVTGQVSIVKQTPGTNPVPIFLEGERPGPGFNITVGRRRSRS